MLTVKLFRVYFLGFLLLCHAGCNYPLETGKNTGSEKQAREFVEQEFSKLLAGQSSELQTMDSALKAAAPPIKCEITSVVNDQPYLLGMGEGIATDSTAQKWPAYRFRILFTWNSKAGTPILKTGVFTVTWNAKAGTWHAAERF